MHQPIEISAINLEEGTFNILNRHHFANLERYNVNWKVEADGKVIENGILNTPKLNPLENGTLKIAYKKPKVRPGEKYCITISFKLNQTLSWAKKGHEIAWEQFELAYYTAPETKSWNQIAALKIQDTDKSIQVITKNTTVILDKSTGFLSSLLLENVETLKSPLKPNFWRPPTDNDVGSKMPKRQAYWKKATQKLNLKSLSTKIHDEKSIRIETVYELPEIENDGEIATGTIKVIYTVFGNGEILVNSTFMPKGKLPNLPRFGMQIQLDDAYDTMHWLGRGPHENYSDRLTSAANNLYSKSVKNDFFHYVRPQESNNYTGVRWVSLTNTKGKGIEILGILPLSVSAWPYSTEDLSHSRGHIADLPKRDFITFNIDHKLMGVGGDTSWSIEAKPHKQFRLPSKAYDYSFVIRPISKSAKKIDYSLPPLGKL